MGGTAAPDYDSLAARPDMESLKRPLEKTRVARLVDEPQAVTRLEVIPHDGTPSADTP